jgi:Kelch motif
VAAWAGSYPTDSNVASTLVYDPAVNEWSTLAGLPPSRQRGAAAVIVSADEKTIYVSHGTTGGHETDNHADALPYLDAYDIATDTWQAISDTAPNPRDHCAGAMIDGRICVVGGRNGDVIGWPSVTPTDCYNIQTGVWELEAPIPVPRAGMAYTQTCDGRLMIAGGEGSGVAFDTVEIFDGQTWKTLNPLTTTRHGTGIARDCHCNQLHIASGAQKAGSDPELKSIETFFPDGVDTRCTERS